MEILEFWVWGSGKFGGINFCLNEAHNFLLEYFHLSLDKCIFLLHKVSQGIYACTIEFIQLYPPSKHHTV